MKRISRKTFGIAVLLLIFLLLFLRQVKLEKKAKNIEENVKVAESKLSEVILNYKHIKEDEKSQYYEGEEKQTQKYHVYEKNWKTFQYFESKGSHNFVGCLQFQYPNEYSLDNGEDNRYFSVSDNLGNSVGFVWDYMGDYCANIGCNTYDPIKLPENVTQNYAVVKKLSKPNNTTALGPREQYFAEVFLNNTGYRVVLRSIKSSDFTNQLKILSTLTLGRYSCVDEGERDFISPSPSVGR